MAKLPDGWIFIPKANLKINGKQAVMECNFDERELVFCGSCRKRHTSDCPLSSSLQLKQPDDWFCKDGEK